MGTNSPDRPLFEGQISVFQSPHHPAVLLVDIACLDRYNQLRWNAVPHETQLYADCVAWQKRVNRLERQLQQLAEKFLDVAGPSLPSALVTDLKARARNLVEFHRVLRAAAASCASVSSFYWDVIDAIGFFEDATGNQWRYLTDDGRLNCIAWAEALVSRHL